VLVMVATTSNMHAGMWSASLNPSWLTNLQESELQARAALRLPRKVVTRAWKENSEAHELRWCKSATPKAIMKPEHNEAASSNIEREQQNELLAHDAAVQQQVQATNIALGPVSPNVDGWVFTEPLHGAALHKHKYDTQTALPASACNCAQATGTSKLVFGSADSINAPLGTMRAAFRPRILFSSSQEAAELVLQQQRGAAQQSREQARRLQQRTDNAIISSVMRVREPQDIFSPRHRPPSSPEKRRCVTQGRYSHAGRAPFDRSSQLHHGTLMSIDGSVWSFASADSCETGASEAAAAAAATACSSGVCAEQQQQLTEFDATSAVVRCDDEEYNDSDSVQIGVDADVAAEGDVALISPLRFS
jgi:hypothetical protein